MKRKSRPVYNPAGTTDAEKFASALYSTIFDNASNAIIKSDTSDPDDSDKQTGRPTIYVNTTADTLHIHDGVDANEWTTIAGGGGGGNLNITSVTSQAELDAISTTDIQLAIVTTAFGSHGVNDILGYDADESTWKTVLDASDIAGSSALEVAAFLTADVHDDSDVEITTTAHTLRFERNATESVNDAAYFSVATDRQSVTALQDMAVEVEGFIRGSISGGNQNGNIQIEVHRIRGADDTLVGAGGETVISQSDNYEGGLNASKFTVETNDLIRVQVRENRDRNIRITLTDGRVTFARVGAVTPASGGGITAVASDATLTGTGVTGSLLSVANPFTDTDETKLDGIEDNATADQTADEIKTAYESNADTNAFTDADHTKLDGIEAGAQVNTLPDAPDNTASQANYELQVPADDGDATWVAATGGGSGLSTVASDTTLTGTGATGSPLSVANPFTDADEAKLDRYASNPAGNAATHTGDWQLISTYNGITFNTTNFGSGNISEGTIMVGAPSGGSKQLIIHLRDEDLEIVSYAGSGNPNFQTIRDTDNDIRFQGPVTAITQVTGNVYRLTITDTSANGVANNIAHRLVFAGKLAVTDDTVLDLAQTSRSTSDRGKALGTLGTDENQLALLDIPVVPDVPDGLPDAPDNTSSQQNYELQVPSSSGPATWAPAGTSTVDTRQDNIAISVTGVSFGIEGQSTAPSGIRGDGIVSGGRHWIDYRDMHGKTLIMSASGAKNINLADLNQIVGANAVETVRGSLFYAVNTSTSGDITFSGGGIANIRPTSTEGGATVKPGYSAWITFEPETNGTYTLSVNAWNEAYEDTPAIRALQPSGIDSFNSFAELWNSEIVVNPIFNEPTGTTISSSATLTWEGTTRTVTRDTDGYFRLDASTVGSSDRTTIQGAVTPGGRTELEWSFSATLSGNTTTLTQSQFLTFSARLTADTPIGLALLTTPLGETPTQGQLQTAINSAIAPEIIGVENELMELRCQHASVTGARLVLFGAEEREYEAAYFDDSPTAASGTYPATHDTTFQARRAIRHLGRDWRVWQTAANSADHDTNNTYRVQVTISRSSFVGGSASSALTSAAVRQPQYFNVYGRFADNTLVNGVPTPAPDFDYLDTLGPARNAGTPWHEAVDAPALDPNTNPNPLWRASNSARWDNTGTNGWVIRNEEWSYERVNDTQGAILYASDASGTAASETAFAGWDYFAFRQPDGTLSEWLPRNQEPRHEQLLVAHANSFGGSRTFNTYQTWNLNDYHTITARIHNYRGNYAQVSYTGEASIDASQVTVVGSGQIEFPDINAEGVINPNGYGLRFAVGGPHLVSSLTAVTQRHGQTSWNTPNTPTGQEAGMLIDFLLRGNLATRQVSSIYTVTGGFPATAGCRFELWGISGGTA